MDDLIERVGKLTGPDREVDGLIAYHTDFRTEDDIDEVIGTWRAKVDRLGWDHALKSLHSSTNVWSRWIPHFTGSLDATTQEVARQGFQWLRKSQEAMTVYRPLTEEQDARKEWAKHFSGVGPTPAIALLLALLSALRDRSAP